MFWVFLLGIVALYGLVRLADDLRRLWTRRGPLPLPTLLVYFHNQEHLVEGFVRRLLATEPDLPLVLADTGSTDATTVILSRLAATHNFRLVTNVSPCRCPLNFGRPAGPVWCFDARGLQKEDLRTSPIFRWLNALRASR